MITMGRFTRGLYGATVRSGARAWAPGGTDLYPLRSWRYKSLGGSGIGIVCLEFFGLEISLGDWRKAVSRMAAPRGPTVDHR